MDQGEILDLLKNAQALVTGSHLVYTSGRHGDTYVNKDALYPHTEITSKLCATLARHFEKQGVEVVLAPAIGGVILAQWISHHLTISRGREVLSLYAEKTPHQDGFVIRRGYDKLLQDKKCLIAEDVMTTGGSVKKIVELAIGRGAKIVGVGALCNRGGVTAKDLGGIPELFALVNLDLVSWPKTECPLCARGVPIDARFGKGTIS